MTFDANDPAIRRLAKSLVLRPFTSAEVRWIHLRRSQLREQFETHEAAYEQAASELIAGVLNDPNFTVELRKQKQPRKGKP